jgi:hypothetical protein
MEDDVFYVQLIICIYPIGSLNFEEVDDRMENCRSPTDHREVKPKGNLQKAQGIVLCISK